MKALALIVVTSISSMNGEEATGFWLSELTHPYYALVDSGVDVDIVSIEGGIAPIDPRSKNEDDPLNERFMADELLVKNLATIISLSEVDESKYQAIVFAGGHGTMWDFPTAPAVQDKAMSIYNQGGVIAAICHGPAALVNLRLENGDYFVAEKKVAGFTNEEERIVGLTEVVPFLLQDKLIERGAIYQEAEPWSRHVVVDGRLITGQNPQSAAAVGKTVSELLHELQP
jgi:putative intracellular protease/amidase